MVSAMKIKFNRNFYTDPSFYIYFIVTFFWILDIPDASDVYEKKYLYFFYSYWDLCYYQDFI